MKHLGPLILTLTVVSCFQGTNLNSDEPPIITKIDSSEKTIEKDNEETNSSIDSGKIDLATELKKQWGDYIMRLNDSVLSFCNHPNLYNPFGTFDHAELNLFLKGYNASRDSSIYGISSFYKSGDNYIEVAKWQDEHTGNNEIDFGKGVFKDSSIFLNSDMKIGMPKNELLKKFFNYDHLRFKMIKAMTNCKDERGDGYTTYYFKSGNLDSIKFGTFEN